MDTDALYFLAGGAILVGVGLLFIYSPLALIFWGGCAMFIGFKVIKEDNDNILEE